MKQLAKAQARIPEALQDLYAPVRDELLQVEEVIRGQLSSDSAFVDRLAKYGFRLGGKRLRPALVLLAGRAAGELKPAHVQLAAAVEIIHTATLIHDDVLDEAMLRRHLETVNARWDNEASVLLGDYLFARAVCLASAVDDNYACQAIGEASRVMCEGELQQMASRGNFELTEDQYLSIIAAKTAELIACCCRLGAYYGGGSEETVQRFADFGYDLGVAFQIADDLLDLMGDESRTGKSLGTDLLKQKPTLPLIRLLGQVNSEQRAEIVEELTRCDRHHRDVLRCWMDRCDALDYSGRKAIEHATSAAARLDDLPPSPECDALRGVIHFVIKRDC